MAAAASRSGAGSGAGRVLEQAVAAAPGNSWRVFPEGGCRAVSGSAEECNRAARVRARCPARREASGCLLWAAAEESPAPGAAGAGGWEPAAGTGCWRSAEEQRPANRSSGLLRGWRVEQEEKSFWQVVLERQRAAERPRQDSGCPAVPAGGWLAWGALALASSWLATEQERFHPCVLGNQNPESKQAVAQKNTQVHYPNETVYYQIKAISVRAYRNVCTGLLINSL